ncbi:DUF4951 domain-containing protein [Acinetobacter sp. ANC 3903]|uniref:DUF4951 domain-containing protein n=1 Tax=Acinetobacter sp. ANC 3903 TaxID=1977883 RepID=UPI003A0FF312
MIRTWHKFYENETQSNLGNLTILFRAQLIKKLLNFTKFSNFFIINRKQSLVLVRYFIGHTQHFFQGSFPCQYFT